MSTSSTAMISESPSAPAHSSETRRRKILRRILMGAGVVFGLWIALNGVLLWWGSNQVKHPFWMEQDHTRSIDKNPRTKLGYDYEDVTFPTDGGVMLSGWFVPAQGGATAGVVYVHGGGG